MLALTTAATLSLTGIPPVAVGFGLEVRYQVTPSRGVALRSSLLPIAPSWRI